MKSDKRTLPPDKVVMKCYGEPYLTPNVASNPKILILDEPTAREWIFVVMP